MELSQAITFVDHRKISSPSKTIWADLGCGSGLFTTALASKLAMHSRIYAIDKNEASLKKIPASSNVTIEKITADFIKDDLNLQPLDGILMANSLHFVQDKISLLHKLCKYLKEGGFFLIIEYDTDIANQWVPFPVSHHALHQLFSIIGYDNVQKIHEFPSRYNQANIYAVLIQRTP